MAPGSSGPQEGPQFREASEQPLLVTREMVLHRRELHFYELSDGELDRLASGYVSVAQSLCGVFFGVLVTLVVTLFTVPLDTLGHAVVAALALASLGVVALTLIYAVRDWREARAVIRQIKAQRE